MIEVMIDSVRINLMSPQRLVVLREVGRERYLPIWVGPYEAEAITIALQEVEVIRPLTHDLLKNVFTAFNARIKRVEIVALKEDIFYGNIVAEVNGREMNLDSRPSDAIALAVRAHAPILVDEAVMQTAGILPEANIETPTAAPAQGSAPPRSAPAGEVSSERLSVFEDFLEKLDLDKDKPDEDQEQDNKPDAPPKPGKPGRPKKK